MSASSDAVSPGLAERAQKRCEWNRYCSFIGPFCPERLIEVHLKRPLLVGRCYLCGGFVCSRCAGRRAVPGLFGGGAARQLLCPRDGTPLGRGDDWISFRSLESATSTHGAPDASGLARVQAAGGDLRLDSPSARRAHSLLAEAWELAARGETAAGVARCTAALEQDPARLLALIVRRLLLERLGRVEEAWCDLRALFDAAPAALADALAEVQAMPAAGAALAESCSEEIFRLLLMEAVTLPEEWKAGPSVVDGSARAPESPEPEPPHTTLPTKLPTVHSTALAFAHPSFTTRLIERCAPSATKALVVLCHEPGVVEQQVNVYRQLEHIVSTAPDVPILLEGFNGRRADESRAVKKPDPRLAQAMALMEKGAAAGEAMLRLAPRKTAIFGVDDPALLDRQGAERNLVLQTLGPLAAAEMLLLDLTSVELEEQATTVRGENVGRLTALRKEADQTQRFTEYLQKLAPMAGQSGVSLQGYPSIAALLRAFEMERELDFDEVERQRMGLIEQLAAYTEMRPTSAMTARLSEWCAAESAEEAALDARYPELLQMAGIAPRRPPPKRGLLGRLFAAEPEPPPLPELYWFAKLLLLSKAYADSSVSQYYYHLRLRGLLKALECPIAPDLSKYMDYVLLANNVDLDALTTAELPAFEHELRCALSASAAEFGIHTLLREYGVLSRLFNFQLPAVEVPVGTDQMSLLRWTADAIRLRAYLPDISNLRSQLPTAASNELNHARNALLQFVTRWEKALPHALGYHCCAIERSRRLFAASLAGAFADAPVRVLVCGRFHLPSIISESIRAQISLVVLAPFPEPVSAGGPVSRTRWASADRHDAGRPLR